MKTKQLDLTQLDTLSMTDQEYENMINVFLNSKNADLMQIKNNILYANLDEYYQLVEDLQ